MDNKPEFIVGEHVAVIGGRPHNTTHVCAVIERETKTLWITDSGRRFRKSDGYESGQRDSWYLPNKLYPVTNPYAIRVEKAQQLEREKARVLSAIAQWGITPTDVELLIVVAKEVNTYKESLLREQKNQPSQP